LVIIAVVVLFASLLVVMRPRRRTSDDVEHETLNPDVEAGREPGASGPDGDRLLGNPPIDRITTGSGGAAVPGEGAGGWTDNPHDPLTAAPNDVGHSPDQA
jgi:hypothetical protein